MTWEKVNAQRDRIAELTRQGLTPPVIAEMLHISTRTVGRARRKRGVAQHAPSRRLTTAEIDQARTWLDDGASYAEVGRTLGRSPEGIRQRLPGYAYTRTQIAEMATCGRIMAALERNQGGRDEFRSGNTTTR